MRDCRVLVLLGLCLLHSVCYGKPLEDKRSRVSTKAILKLESQLKDMAGEEDKPTTHRTTAKAPLILPVDETEDSPPVAPAEDQEEEQEEETQEDALQEPEEEQQQETQDAQDEDIDDLAPEEAELFGKILAMTGEHPELLDMSVDDFQAILQKIQEREKEAELYAQAAENQADEVEEPGPLSPEQMRERIQWLKGDEDAKVVAKKNMFAPVDVLRRRAEEEELQEQAIAKRQPEVIEKKSAE